MNTIHLVSHTHWDREWYLTFQQFRLKLIYVIDELLEILETDPDFKYYLLDGQTIILEDYLQIRSERESDILQYIKNGRIMIGPWYVSPDEFLISPESHIRNLLEGDKLCQIFGGKMSVGYLPDTFGHIGQMPQILQGFGIDSACLWRGLSDQPCELTWFAPDGSSVLVSYLRDSYSNAASLTTSNPDKFIIDVHERSLSLTTHSLTGQILLMHGTDHMVPTKELTRSMSNYRIKTQSEPLIHSNLPLYFDSVGSQLESSNQQVPIISGELRSSKHSALLPNVLSTRIWLKQRNNECENELLKWVEPLHVWNNLLDISDRFSVIADNKSHYPSLINQNSIIRYAWKLLMQCHPHDSICGTSIDQVANEMRVRFDQVDQISKELVNQSLQYICEQIDTRLPLPLVGDQSKILSTIIVFNPNDALQSGLVNFNIKIENKYTSFEIIDDLGNKIPYDHSGTGPHELISMALDKKALKQALGMIHEGSVAGMIIRDFDIERQETRAVIRATLSDHGSFDINKWNQGSSQLDLLIANPSVNEFIIQAFSDPEIDLSIVARDVPGHGYRSYWLRGFVKKHLVTSKPVKLNPLIQGLLPLISWVTRIPLFSRLVEVKKHKSPRFSNKIENEYFIVEVQPGEGAINITDKRTHQVYTGLNRFIDSADCGDLYNFCPPERDLAIYSMINKVQHDEKKTYQKLIIYSILKVSARISDDRKSRSREWVNNTIKSTIMVVSGLPRVDIHTEIDNQACDHRLRVHFPAPFNSTDSLHDGHFEIVQRTVGIPDYDKTWEEPPRPEVPQCQFTTVVDEQLSLTIANRGLPEVEVLKNKTGNAEIAITLLRCVGWLSRDDITTRKGHAGPMGIATPEAQMIGKFSFDYSIITGDNNWQKSIHQAYSFNSPLRAIDTTVHPGTIPSKCSFIENRNESFIITTIKTAEDDLSFIVRGYNILSAPIDVSIKPWRTFSHAQLVKLDENIIEELVIAEEGFISIHIGGNKIVTIRFSN